ncbi:hypothetical protein [Algoriphagus sp. NG3]|uniref:hypothetical protein n=1 Tax=Algoriphagus sp. NG3 TaxID=3097546 RepID=UPI002A82629E|nr:hypothetical protein [Algoriphagus sp. NG3]WPR77962.1 hypothetical protein SLW71_11460 [Algoriphagus sp. NG3]
MIWHKNLFDKEKKHTFSPLAISPGTENEYLFFKFVEEEPPYFLKYWLDYYQDKGIKIKPQYLKAIKRQIKKEDFTNPHTFPDYFGGEFDFISMAFQLVSVPKEIVCSLGLAFVKNGELVYWTRYHIIPPDEEGGFLIPNDRIVRLHEIEPAQNFKDLWDSTLSEILNKNFLVLYDSVVELSILKSLFLNYGVISFDFWYTDVLSLVELSGNSERVAELEEFGFKVKTEDDALEDAVTYANVFHELSKVYPNFVNHVSHMSFGNKT